MLAEANLSEFQGFTGDCMWLAALGALHALDPDHYNLSPTNLDALVRVAQARREAGAEGQATIADVADVLRNYYGVSIQVYPFAQPFHTDWRELLADNAGTHPVLLELANGGALAGDEQGLHFHGVAQLNRGEYVDGDNGVAKTGAMCHYTDEEIAAAEPCGALVVIHTHYPTPTAPASHEARYTVQRGDTLSAIATRLHLTNWYHELYQPNQAEIEAEARAHGQPDSNGGNLIYAGEVLTYRAA